MLKVTCFAQKCDFGPKIVPPVASKMRPAGHHFRQKGPQRWSTPNESEPPEADLGATRGPKQRKGTFSWIQDRFWTDVGMDFRAIWARFRSNLSYHLWSLIRIPNGSGGGFAALLRGG